MGGVAAGMSTAARLRRLEETATITVIEKSNHVSFANCGLPYHVGGIIEERTALLLQTPQTLTTRFNINVRTRTEATAINRDAKTLHIRDLTTGNETDLPYDALVLAPGATPIRPPIPGIERAKTLRNIEDTDAIIDAAAKAQTAIVIGGGFIGVEMAENLLHRGLKVTLIEASPQVMPPIDKEMVAQVHQTITDAGITLRLSTTVTAISENHVELHNGEQLTADLVITAIGVRPESHLAAQAGLQLGEHGGIIVDDHYRTSDPSIYAAGDAAQKKDAITGTDTLIPLANTANLQGRRIADTITGRDVPNRPVLGTAIVGILGLQVATVGWNEKRLIAAGRQYRAIHTHPTTHANYYPGANSLALKLLIDPHTDTILGAQAIGKDGADKRIDIIATAMQAGLHACDLAELELAYAPQFGSAKDPINMLGFIAENRATGVEKTIQWHELATAQHDGATLIDVRTPTEFTAGAIPGAINVPLDELRERLTEIPQNNVIVHCAVGIRGHIASRILTAAGYHVRNLDGGYRTWAAGTTTHPTPKQN
ncbi:Coenzyme A disulfide reductase [Dermatophilus congolensis]|uniref:Coenzyme A disulfide reductase n=1 Tax=Dermatophilus congolensis TaxID=1863 RepID=A0A239VSI6_9MICO|nr:Coenzyme A disulfide reductase [Dermatophilus congolensis]